jgi:hypothetical protein
LKIRKKEEIGETTGPPKEKQEGSEENPEIQENSEKIEGSKKESLIQVVQEFTIENEGSKKFVGKTVGNNSVIGKRQEKKVQKIGEEFNHTQRNNDKVVQKGSSNANQENDYLTEYEMISREIDNEYNPKKDDIFCSEIKSTYIKRIDTVHYIKWLHKSNEDEERILYMRTRLDNFNQIMKLRMALYRSNFDVIGLCKIWEEFDVDDLPIIGGRIEKKFNIKEKGQIRYYWNTLNRLGNGILDKEDTQVFMDPDNDDHMLGWKKYGDKQKILHVMSIMLRTKIQNRMSMIGKDNKMELKMNRDYWERFNVYWRSFIRTAYTTNWSWDEFIKKAQVGIQGFMIQEEMITQENWKEMKDLSVEEIFADLERPSMFADRTIRNLFWTVRAMDFRFIQGYLAALD